MRLLVFIVVSVCLLSSCYNDDIQALKDEIARLEEEARKREAENNAKLLDNQEKIKLFELELQQLTALDAELQRLISEAGLSQQEIAALQDKIEQLTDSNYSTYGQLTALQQIILQLKSIIALHSAYNAGKTIASTEEKTIDTLLFKHIAFTDESFIDLPVTVVDSLWRDEATGEYHITLYDMQTLIFNPFVPEDVIYPTGIVLLTQSRAMLKGGEVSVDFRINPPNAKFQYNPDSANCDIALDKTGTLLRSLSVNNPANYHLAKVEPATDENGNVREGQYRGYIRDRGGYSTYNEAVALVVSSRDANGNPVQLSSSALYLQRKIDTHLPIVSIRTEHDKLIADKENWVPASMTIDGVSVYNDYAGTIGIKGRGNTTWSYPKKPYAIKLDSKSEILGMPSHKRWVLLANYLDRTLMRNFVAFEIAKCTGLEWTPRGTFVELVLNDEHLGNYFLCEQITTGKYRVNVEEMDADDLDEEAITGGYLLECDINYDEVNKFYSTIAELPFMFKEPDEDVLQAAQFDYMRSYIDSTEKYLYDDLALIERKYTDYIDDTTFIDFWLANEVVYNAEPGHPKSCYMYKDRGGLLKAGPVWDFDWNTFTTTSGFACKDAMWYSQFFKDSVFVAKVKERWTKFKPAFEALPDVIEAQRTKIYHSDELNNEMWPFIYNKLTVNGDEKLTHQEAVKKLVTNYKARIQWLNTNINNMQ